MKLTLLFSVSIFLTFWGNSTGGPVDGHEGHFVAMGPVGRTPGTTAGVFAATTTGLVALNLQTLEATSLSSENAFAVSVNHNLKKVYWSETSGNNRIMRSNFNGSAKEVIVPPTGGYIFALAVHEPSGNIYFSVRSSSEITVCNAVGKNCSAAISSSSVADYVYSIAFDPENNLMYWTNYEIVRTSFIRASLDGSSVARIANFFTSSTAVITLAQPSYDTLYWTHIYDDTIGTMQVNGSNKRTLVELEGKPGPVGIQVDAQKIYFGNYDSKTIQSVDRDSGEGLTTLFNSTGRIYHLALY